MSWELVGSCGNGQSWQLQIGLAFLSSIFEEPEGCELDIMYTDYEFSDGTLGAYGSIGLSYDNRVDRIEQFASRCQNALSVFSDHVDWSKLAPETLAERFSYQLSVGGRLKVLDDKEIEAEEDDYYQE